MKKTLVLPFALLALAVACGGSIDVNPDGGSCPVNPTGSCSNEGQKCDFQANICGSPGTETCTCQSGGWLCPDYMCPVEVCPTSISPNMPCSTVGMKCEVTASYCGGTGSVPCTCNGSQFQCVLPNCPVQTCPAPTSIVPGGSCDVPAQTQCSASICGYSTLCTCNAYTWWCNADIGCDGGLVDASGSD